MEDRVVDLDRVVLDPNKTKHGRKDNEISKDEADTITFTRDAGVFRITDIRRSNTSTTNNPFFVPLPFDSTAGSDLIHRANSGPATPDAQQGQYTAFFDIVPPVGGHSSFVVDFKIKS